MERLLDGMDVLLSFTKINRSIMTNNKQLTAVEQLINHLMEYGFDLSLHKMEIEHFKEMEKDQHVKSWEAGLMKVDFNEYYEQTYGGNK